MADVIMPQMGESIAEGTVTKWLKNVGDRVERDEPLFEISTDKVDAEIPSPAAGVLQRDPGRAGRPPCRSTRWSAVIAAEGETDAGERPAAAAPAPAVRRRGPPPPPPPPPAAAAARRRAPPYQIEGEAPPPARPRHRPTRRRSSRRALVQRRPLRPRRPTPEPSLAPEAESHGPR